MRATRRQFLKAGAFAPWIVAGRTASAAPRTNVAPITESADDLPPPKYQLAMNLEILFPKGMPYETRIVEAARCGARHYGFWGYAGRDLDAMSEAQREHGMTCVSITGAPKTGWSSGLTRAGAESAFLDDFEGACRAAGRLQAKNLITFVGPVQKDEPWEAQRERVVEGLRKAALVAEKYDVYLVLEPLNRVESPQMSMLTAEEAFGYCEDVDHPRVKVDFDIYHRQLGEGNVLNMLDLGLKAGHVRFIEVGDVPGRKEPGTGETNYANIFAYLRRVGYDGAIGMEHGTTRTPQHAWDAVNKLAGLG